MVHEIRNAQLAVSAHETGAQLWSILGADGTQYLWQGDKAYWGDRALTLFPYVARLWQGKYRLDQTTYSMPIHGFAPTADFALREKTETSMTFELCESEETLAQYPRRFCFRVTYALRGNRLDVIDQVQNRDEKPLYFGLGGHPGFQVPLEKGKAFEDYRLRFGAPCSPMRVGFSEDCFVTGKDSAFPLQEDTILPLQHALFDEDAIVLRDMARAVTLEAPGGRHSVRVSFPDMPYLGIWHWPKTDAPYVCIEPWLSLPAKHGEIVDFETQADLIRLEPGGTYENRWSIEMFA